MGSTREKTPELGKKRSWYGWNCLGVPIGFPRWGAGLSLAYRDSGLAVGLEVRVLDLARCDYIFLGVGGVPAPTV